MNIKTRQQIERRIAKQIVKSALAQGYSISLDNGGEQYEIEQASKASDIHKEMFATDEETLAFFKDGKCRGVVFLVYGNDGYDVINDHTANEVTDNIMKEANALAEKLEQQYG